MPVQIRPMTLVDYESVRRLWESCDGVGLSDADQPQALKAYLTRNPGMSFVALDNESIVGAVLCGHDGRRGYLNHLAVSANHRARGIGRLLVGHCLEALQFAGITKCHLFIFSDNQTGRTFWRQLGWELREDLSVASWNLAKG